MSIIRITRDLIEKATVTTRPEVRFVSSSQTTVNDQPEIGPGPVENTGTMGSTTITPRRNPTVKGIREFDPESALFDEAVAGRLKFLESAKRWNEKDPSTSGVNPYAIAGFLGSCTSGSHISTDDGNCARALITISAVPTDGQTIILTDAGGTSDTYTFRTSVTQANSTKENVGISDVTTTSGVAISLRKSINLACVDDDIQITAAIPAGNELIVYMLTKGMSGNSKTITGTAISDSSPPISVTTFSKGTNRLPADKSYMKAVHDLALPARSTKTFQITRFRPPWLFQNDHDVSDTHTDNHGGPGEFVTNHRMVKNQVRNVLLPTYRSGFTHPNYAYTNYHTLNFHTSSVSWTKHGSSIEATEANSAPYKWMNSKVLIYSCLTGSRDKFSYGSTEEDDRINLRFSGKYAPQSAFTFDFYINPRYTNEVDNTPKKGDFKAGTIFHMSGAYAISLVSGSSKAPDGSANGYRIMLQLSQSAEHPPSKWKMVPGHDRPIFGANNSNYKASPYEYAWVSPDNSLKKNHWHHVAIRWSPKTNNGTGSFVVDGKKISEFTISFSGSVMPYVNQDNFMKRAKGDRFPAGRSDPNALFIGNFYEGTNTTGSNATTIERFFNHAARKAGGFSQPNKPAGNTKSLTVYGGVRGGGCAPGDPYSFSFNHPLNAEVHDLKIYNTYRSDSQILTSSIRGPESLDDLLFYVPPFYLNEYRERNFLRSAKSGSHPSQYSSSGYDKQAVLSPYLVPPINAGLLMNIQGSADINVENFCKDIANDSYPRLVYMTASIDGNKMNTSISSAHKGNISNFLMWNFCTGAYAIRSTAILPCDNGKFSPNYDLVYTGSEAVTTGSQSYLYRDDLGNFDPSLINISDLFVTPPAELTTRNDDDGRLLPTPGYISGSTSYPSPGKPFYSIQESYLAYERFLAYQGNRDPSSDHIVLFNVSNLFYGNRIEPGTFMLTDSDISGSRGKIGITLKDDGYGTLYRADSATTHAKSNGVGNIFYNEGIILIKSPHLALFGKDQFEMSFRGEQNIHVMAVNIPCRPGLINSSSNPGFKVLSASLNANDTDSEFVYITGINLHDDNMNVIMKVNLAQPVVKRDSDDMLFRAKIDF